MGNRLRNGFFGLVGRRDLEMTGGLRFRGVRAGWLVAVVSLMSALFRLSRSIRGLLVATGRRAAGFRGGSLAMGTGEGSTGEGATGEGRATGGGGATGCGG